MTKLITCTDDWIAFTCGGWGKYSYSTTDINGGYIDIYTNLHNEKERADIRIFINHTQHRTYDEGAKYKGVAVSFKEPRYIFDNEFCSRFTSDEKELFITILKSVWHRIVNDLNIIHYVAHDLNDRLMDPEWENIPDDYHMPDYSILEIEED